MTYLLTTRCKQVVRVATQYASAPASWQYLRIYSPGGGAFSA